MPLVRAFGFGEGGKLNGASVKHLGRDVKVRGRDLRIVEDLLPGSFRAEPLDTGRLVCKARARDWMRCT